MLRLRQAAYGLSKERSRVRKLEAKSVSENPRSAAGKSWWFLSFSCALCVASTTPQACACAHSRPRRAVPTPQHRTGAVSLPGALLCSVLMKKITFSQPPGPTKSLFARRATRYCSELLLRPQGNPAAGAQPCSEQSCTHGDPSACSP